jgi:Holliday junction resolvase RusA-like endonuclease
MDNEITLPWPSAILSPNARPHWAAKAKAVKKARIDGKICARLAGAELPATDGKIHLWIDFHPPSKRRIDDDNCLARFKSARDGIADYYGIDDARFVSHPLVKESIKGGKVIVRITAGTEA